MRPPRYTLYGPFAAPFPGPDPAIARPDRLALDRGFHKRNTWVALHFDAV
jgi:hypothetical protein